MSVPLVVVIGLIAAFAVTGIVVCLSFPYARAIKKDQERVVTKYSLARGLAFSFAVVTLVYYVDRSIWFCIALLVWSIVWTAMVWPKATRR